MAKRKPPIPAQTNRLPINIRRSGIMCRRAAAVFRNVRLMEEAGPFLTRTCYRNNIECVLGVAAQSFCRYQYAKVNGKRAEAARCWEEVTGAVEYELPMAILHPVKDLKGRKSREHAVEKVMLIIRAEMATYKKWVESLYTASDRKSGKKSHVWKTFRLKKPLVRPAERCFEEFFDWARDMVMDTFQQEAMMRANFMRKKR